MNSMLARSASDWNTSLLSSPLLSPLCCSSASQGKRETNAREAFSLQTIFSMPLATFGPGEIAVAFKRKCQEGLGQGRGEGRRLISERPRLAAVH